MSFWNRKFKAGFVELNGEKREFAELATELFNKGNLLHNETIKEDEEDEIKKGAISGDEER